MKKNILVAALIAMAIGFGYKFFYKKQSENTLPLVVVAHMDDSLGNIDIVKGIKDRIKNSDFIPGKKINFQIKSAQGKEDFISSITEEISDLKPKILATISTPITKALLPIANKIGTPVIYTSFLSLKVSKDLQIATCFVKDVVSAKARLKSVLEVMPNIKNICVITHEKDSHLKHYKTSLKSAGKKLNMKVIFQNIDNLTNVAAAASEIVHDVDAFFILHKSSVTQEIKVLIQVANSYKKPVFSSENDLLDQGVVSCLDQDNYEIGQVMGKNIIKLLQGKKISSTTSVKPKLYINVNVAKKLGININENVLAKAEYWDGGKKEK